MQHRLIVLLLKYASPLFLAILVLTAVFGYLRPWAPANDYLSRQSGQFPVQVGFTCKPSACTAGQYVLFPSAFSEPTSVTITKGPTGTAVVVNKYGSLVWLARVLAFAILTWWFWLRRKPQPPNNSFKPNPLRGSA